MKSFPHRVHFCSHRASNAPGPGVFDRAPSPKPTRSGSKVTRSESVEPGRSLGPSRSNRGSITRSESVEPGRSLGPSANRSVRVGHRSVRAQIARSEREKGLGASPKSTRCTMRGTDRVWCFDVSVELSCHAPPGATPRALRPPSMLSPARAKPSHDARRACGGENEHFDRVRRGGFLEATRPLIRSEPRH